MFVHSWYYWSKSWDFPHLWICMYVYIIYSISDMFGYVSWANIVQYIYIHMFRLCRKFLGINAFLQHVDIVSLLVSSNVHRFSYQFDYFWTSLKSHSSWYWLFHLPIVPSKSIPSGCGVSTLPLATSRWRRALLALLMSPIIWVTWWRRWSNGGRWFLCWKGKTVENHRVMGIEWW